MIVRAGRATIALVSCVKSKLPYAAPAEDLYVSDLFKSMRKYAESIAGDWFILSAAHGLLRRRQVIEPYERTLRTMDKQERMAWARRVQVQLGKSLPPASKVVMLAGERYREGLETYLEDHGHKVLVPMRGKPLGMQLRWLKEQTA